MKSAQPQGLSRRRVQQLLSATRSKRFAGARVDFFSRHFLGYPYLTNPLVGSAQRSEVFMASLDGFDCVTYVETILALYLASNTAEFIDWLRKIRYAGGRVDWTARNHYMTAWIRNNARLGAVRRVSAKAPRIAKRRTLNMVPGLPPKLARFDCIPKAFVPRLAPHLRTGDLMFFASTRKHLDVFHCGIIVRDDAALRMRHASRSRGAVVEQDLSEFLKANRMAGVIVARPHEAAEADATSEAHEEPRR